MAIASESSLETRQSLLSRLRDLEDSRSWQQFFDLYWRLLYKVARRAGLDDPDAQDVVQDTLVAVSKELPGFRYDAARGSFKQWLFLIVQRRVADHLRRLYRRPARADLSPSALGEREGGAHAPADPGARDLGEAWDQEWERSILDAAIARVRAQANPKHFQVFDYCVLKEWPVAKVATTLGMNAAQVYLARHRISQAVKRAARQIGEERLQGGLV